MWPAAAADCATSHFRIKNNYPAKPSQERARELASERMLGRSSLRAAGVIFKMEAPTKESERNEDSQLGRQAARTALLALALLAQSQSHTLHLALAARARRAAANQQAGNSSSSSSEATCQG